MVLALGIKSYVDNNNSSADSYSHNTVGWIDADHNAESERR